MLDRGELKNETLGQIQIYFKMNTIEAGPHSIQTCAL